MSDFYTNAASNRFLSALTPNSVQLRDNINFAFFSRYLAQKALSVFKWKIPETWDSDYVQSVLYRDGYICIVNTPEFGVIPQECTLGGLNLYYEPRYALVTNPVIPSLRGQELLIDYGYADANCVVIKLTPDYAGISDLIIHYAEKLALASQGVETNLINSKLAYVFAAEDNSTATAFKKMFQKIVTGDPAVFVDKKLFDENGEPRWSTFTQNLQQNYIAGDIISDLRKIEAEFDTKIGIANANTDKKERLISDEVNANNEETTCLSDLWLDNLQDGIDRVKTRYPGTEISVERRYKKNDRIISDDSGTVTVDTNDRGNV